MEYLIAIFTYLILLVIIGIYKSRQVKTEADFAVAGRTLSPWIMVCTMLAVWIGTGSIVGNAEQTYHAGVAALVIPMGTLFGMILLSFIATHARNVEASSVPEIIGRRYGRTARLLSVFALVTAYMVIVSYQFNAGGAVLEVISGDKEPVLVQADSELHAAFSKKHLTQGRIIYTPPADWTGTVEFQAVPMKGLAQPFTYRIEVVQPEDIAQTSESIDGQENVSVIEANTTGKIQYTFPDNISGRISLKQLSDVGKVEFIEPKLSAKRATIIAAAFIIAYTMLAGLLSLAYMDIVTGILITVSSVVALPVLLIKAGGFSGMSEAFTVMGQSDHMQIWGVYSPVQLVNFLLPVFLLILGDANQYQRIFASRNARGARQAVTVMIFLALGIEMLIIANAWVASSMTPDAENGKYILIYAAKHHMPKVLGVVFLVTVVGIIVSTANSFLLIPSVTFIKDIYQTHINPKASEKQVIFLNRALILVFGVIGYGVSLIFSESTGFFQKALYAYTIYGSAITPSLIAAIAWKRATTAGAITSILSGTVITLLWGEVIQPQLSGWLSELDAVLPAIAISLTTLIGISLLTQSKSTTVEEKGENV